MGGDLLDLNGVGEEFVVEPGVGVVPYKDKSSGAINLAAGINIFLVTHDALGFVDDLLDIVEANEDHREVDVATLSKEFVGDCAVGGSDRDGQGEGSGDGHAASGAFEGMRDLLGGRWKMGW
jgi:hypothetical protein